MAFNLKGRHFLSMKDNTPEEIDFLLQLSIKLKQDKYAGLRGLNLEGKNIALIFEKPSTRTRCGPRSPARSRACTAPRCPPTRPSSTSPRP